jgi:PHD/YefM family antitoxin component YafN of YafNO toxin-antitoxin module
VSDDKELDVLDLPDEVRALVAECEVTGRRTAFRRNGRTVVMLTSYDEYLALRETVEILKDGAFLARITAAEEQVKREAMLLVEDLLEG